MGTLEHADIFQALHLERKRMRHEDQAARFVERRMRLQRRVQHAIADLEESIVLGEERVKMHQLRQKRLKAAARFRWCRNPNRTITEMHGPVM